MKNGRLFKIFPLTMLVLASCTLPPREAWRVIQREGLIPYIAVEIGKKPVPPYVVKKALPGRLLPATVPVTRPRLLASAPGPAPTSSLDSAKSQVAPASRFLEYSPSLTGARVPTMGPPVQPAVAPRPKTIAPEPVTPTLTLKTVPAAPRISEAPKVESRPIPPQSKPAPQVSPATKPVVATTTKPIEPVSKPKAAPAQAPVSALSKTVVADAPVKTTPAPEKPSAPTSTAPANAIETGVVTVPYGTPVPGRPGLVSSPYAGQYQLVDVTGLGAGQEVKCPYSGKIFRVPAAQSVLNIPSTNLASPPDSPEKKQ